MSRGWSEFHKLFRTTSSYGAFYEDVLKQLTALCIAPGDVVVDFGANVGKHTLNFARHVGNGGSVIAIEPNPETFAVLADRVKRSTNTHRITLVNAAGGSSEGMLRFHMNTERPALSSLLKESAGSVDVLKEVDVAVVTLDGLMKQARRLDFVKIDVEGFEFEVLKGAVQSLRAFRPSLFFENNRRAGEVAGRYSMEEFLGYFDALDYVLCAANGMTINKETWRVPGPTNFLAFPRQKADLMREALCLANQAAFFALGVDTRTPD